MSTRARAATAGTAVLAGVGIAALVMALSGGSDRDEFTLPTETSEASGATGATGPVRDPETLQAEEAVLERAKGLYYQEKISDVRCKKVGIEPGFNLYSCSVVAQDGAVYGPTDWKVNNSGFAFPAAGIP